MTASPTLVPQQPKRRHRPRTGMGVFVTDQELIEYLGVPERTARAAIQELDRDPRRSGFPPKKKLWGDRRYLPAVEAWLARQNGLKIRLSQEDKP